MTVHIPVVLMVIYGSLNLAPFADWRTKITNEALWFPYTLVNLLAVFHENEFYFAHSGLLLSSAHFEVVL